ncbi:MAG: asparagine synthase (glutamine-hydrolyzing) [Candidatus Aminicenantes bacterium]|nr:asparagine synthase (glutamine-hydrolyzing) [Candidatus Aminicenantes bacterium]
MCGICGIIQPENSKPIPQNIITSMCQTIIHRGPDDQGVHLEKNVSLGVRRLSIIDLETGHQPLSNEDGSVWTAFNGEIYNFLSLRKELIQKGHQFKTKTDTESIVHSYEQWGDDFVNRTNGMFSICIWDRNQKKLLLIRDRLGIKPLYYTLCRDGTLVFGSELKALLAHPKVNPGLDRKALDLFLTLEYIPAPFTIFENVFKLPAGSMLTYKKGHIVINSYWELNHGQTRTEFKDSRSLESLQDELFHLLKDSVDLRLVSDVPLGAFLSGGIDSSTIVGLMRELGVTPLKTFSIGFEYETYNELEHARRIAHKFDTEHQEFILEPDILQLTEKLIHHLDEPFGDFSIFPTYLVSKMARKSVKVILSGDGGDELLAGYEHYQAQKLSQNPLLFPVHKILPPLIKRFPPSPKKKGLWNKMQRYCRGIDMDPDLRHLRWMMFLSPEEKSSLYTKDFLQSINGAKSMHERDPFRNVFLGMEEYDDLNGELYLDLKTYMVDDILVKVDRMSMAASLETRVPLLDHRIVEFLFQIPGCYKLKGMTSKWIFKKTMERLLPKKNIYRKKEGFSIPIKHWLRRELKEMMQDYLTESRIKKDGLFNHQAVHNLVDSHLKQTSNNSHQIWSLLVFEVWKDTYL